MLPSFLFLTATLCLTGISAQEFSVEKISIPAGCQEEVHEFYDDNLIKSPCDEQISQYQTNPDSRYQLVGDEIYVVQDAKDEARILGNGIAVEYNEPDITGNFNDRILACDFQNCFGIEDINNDFINDFRIPTVTSQSAPTLISPVSTEETGDRRKNSSVSFALNDLNTAQSYILKDTFQTGNTRNTILDLTRINSNGSFAYSYADVVSDRNSLSGRFFNGVKFKRLRILNKLGVDDPNVREDGQVIGIGYLIDFSPRIFIQKGTRVKVLAFPDIKAFRNVPRNTNVQIFGVSDDSLTFAQVKRKFIYYKKNKPFKLPRIPGVKFKQLTFDDMTSCGNIMLRSEATSKLYILKRSQCQ